MDHGGFLFARHGVQHCWPKDRQARSLSGRVRQTVFFLPIDPRDKGHQDPANIDFTVPRRAQYLHSAWKKHQDEEFWVDINLSIQKD